MLNGETGRHKPPRPGTRKATAPADEPSHKGTNRMSNVMNNEQFLATRHAPTDEELEIAQLTQALVTM